MPRSVGIEPPVPECGEEDYHHPDEGDEFEERYGYCGG